MARFVKGDVVVLPFPFSDLSASKRRPALVIASIRPHNDVILCMITSQHTGDGSAIAITRTDFATGNLPSDSNIRPNCLFTADAAIIVRKAGRLKRGKMDAVVREIVRIVSA